MWYCVDGGWVPARFRKVPAVLYKDLQHLPGERCSCRLQVSHVNHRLPWGSLSLPGWVSHQVSPAPDNNTKTTALDWTRAPLCATHDTNAKTTSALTFFLSFTTLYCHMARWALCYSCNRLYRHNWRSKYPECPQWYYSQRNQTYVWLLDAFDEESNRLQTKDSRAGFYLLECLL